MNLIAQGAEAKLYRNEQILVKDRVQKSYRLKEIDEKLRKARTRREAKVLQTLEKAKFPAPRLLKSDDASKLEMDFLDGEIVKDILEKKDYIALSKEIGGSVAKLHNLDIIHGDLTTSNMILKGSVYFIDFGLSFFSKRVEDKAVDLHLFRQALESRHHTICKECFDAFLQEYKKHAADAAGILERFQDVELRGRNKAKY
ncbi:MAG: KEOPS complex kinase/ATPase Bud32 [Nanoarchaeota archaeon]|nr:KEOPS complex kinase/ATPase Bud32 [Nanoarchaeota archaeon]